MAIVETGVSRSVSKCPKGVSNETHVSQRCLSVSDETHVSHAVPNLKLPPPPTGEMRLIEGAASLHGVVVGSRGLIVDICIDAV